MVSECNPVTPNVQSVQNVEHEVTLFSVQQVSHLVFVCESVSMCVYAPVRAYTMSAYMCM